MEGEVPDDRRIMSKRTDDLFAKVVQNIHDDREILVELRDKIIQIGKGDAATLLAEPVTLAAVAENVSKLTDALTKMNSQLVELTKVSSKSDEGEKDKDQDKESIFDEIENQSETSTN